MDNALWGALVLAAVTGLMAALGKKFESAGSRAVEAQGAAGKAWQDLAVMFQQRAELLAAQLEQEKLLAAAAEEKHHEMVRGLESRLQALGADIRRPGQPSERPVHERERA